MLPVLFGDTCDWKWKGGPTVTVKQKERRQRSRFSSQPFTFYFHFLNHELSPSCSIPATFMGPSSHSTVTEWPRRGGEGGGVKRDDRVRVKDVGGKRGWLGVCTDFHFSPSAYVKMLSLSPSQVLPLQMPELSVCNGLYGG